VPSIKQVILCGSGGQGIVLAGSILGQAAFNDGKWVSSTDSYGAAARGGACRAEVVMSERPVIFPYVMAADMLIAMCQTAYDRYVGRVKPNEGVVIYDERFIPEEMKGLKYVGIAATRTAIEELSSGMAANVIIVSAAVEMTDLVSKAQLESAIKEVIPERLRELNLKAMNIGFRLGRTHSNHIQQRQTRKGDRLTPVAGRTHIPMLDQQRCRICDLCRLLCPDLAITENGSGNQIEIDCSYCKGCGICAVACPRDAIKMMPEESAG
jgi:2-oxoglutarate ferredoxin oxidoreductase subunit gamma